MEWWTGVRREDTVMLEIKTVDKPDERRDFPAATWRPCT